MHRRTFITGAKAALLSGATFPRPAIAQGFRELRMVTTWPKNLPGLGTSAERVAHTVRALSAGRIQIKVFGAGQLVDAFEAFQAVSQGLADMYHGAEYYWESRSPAFSFFSTVPFGFTAAEMSCWVEFGGGKALWDELSAGYGLKPFLCGNTGVQMGGWFVKEVSGVESFRGLRYRMPGLGGEVLRRLGAIVVNLPAGQIIPSLRSGAIDASEWIGPWHDMALGLHEVAPYYYYPGFHEPGTALSLGINKAIWDSLPSDDKIIFEAAAALETNYAVSEFNGKNATALQRLRQNPSIKIKKFGDDVLAALGKTAGEVLVESSRKDTLTRRVFDSFIEFRKAAVSWAEISDRSYLNARALDFAYGD